MSVPARPRRGMLLVAACAAALALAGCAGRPATPVAAAPAAAAAPVLTVDDPWVKAAESGMTAVFGTLRTTGTSPVAVLSAQTSASSRTELHEVAAGDGGAMVMRPKADGFVVEPATPHVLGPGGDHIMVMDLSAPIRPGDQVEVMLSLSDGSTTRFTALAKETSGGEEHYDEDAAGAHTPAGQGG